MLLVLNLTLIILEIIKLLLFQKLEVIQVVLYI